MRLNRGLFEDFYSIGKVIGIGTFAEVRVAKSEVTKTDRAVKIINKKHLSRADDIKRFIYEIDLLKNLDHPNILKVYEYFLDSDRLYIVTELVSGTELLYQVNKKKGTKVAYFEEEEAALLIK